MDLREIEQKKVGEKFIVISFMICTYLVQDNRTKGGGCHGCRVHGREKKCIKHTKYNWKTGILSIDRIILKWMLKNRI